MNDKEQNKLSYNKYADLYENSRNSARIKDIKKALSYVKIKNPFILELGCANGREAKEILKYTNNYLGVDISKELIKLARKRAPKGKFKTADFEKFKFPKNLDLIFASASLLHTNKSQVKSVLKKAHQALKEKGIMFLSLKLGKYKREVQTAEMGKRIFYYYTPADIKKLAGNNYKILKVEKSIGQSKKLRFFEIILQKK